jgi:hypothetical protein
MRCLTALDEGRKKPSTVRALRQALVRGCAIAVYAVHK